MSNSTSSIRPNLFDLEGLFNQRNATIQAIMDYTGLLLLLLEDEPVSGLIFDALRIKSQLEMKEVILLRPLLYFLKYQKKKNGIK